MKVLFLDIDGVLNAHEFDENVMCGRIRDDKVSLLNYVLAETGAKVVLSSAWRYIVYRGEATLAGIDWLLRSHGVFCGRLVGITRPDTLRESPDFDGKTWPVHDERGEQITDYLREHPEVERYAVVDDGGVRPDGSWTDLGIGAAGHPFVRTDGKAGMKWADARKLIALLGSAA